MASFPLAIRLPKFQPQLVLKGLAIATAGVGLVIVLAYIWLLQFSPLALLHRSAQSSDILRLAPRQSVMAAALNVPLTDLERLQRYLTPLTKRRSVHQRWQNWLTADGNGPLSDFLSATQLDFGRDIQPWLGPESLIAIATLAPEQPDYFVALATDNVDSSNVMLNLLWRQQYLQQQTSQIELYKGVQLLSVPVAERMWVVAALGDRYTIFATGLDIAREAIDSWQVDELSLASTNDYRAAISATGTSQLGMVYSNLPTHTSELNLWDRSLDTWGAMSGSPTWIGIGLDGDRLAPVRFAAVER
ncbi:MAG: DUF3352 domain-containing protein [Cyanobacteria bacterium P01_E01_bin.34]